MPNGKARRITATVASLLMGAALLFVTTAPISIHHVLHAP